MIQGDFHGVVGPKIEGFSGGQRNVSMRMRHWVVEISVAMRPPAGRLRHRTVGLSRLPPRGGWVRAVCP